MYTAAFSVLSIAATRERSTVNGARRTVDDDDDEGDDVGGVGVGDGDGDGNEGDLLTFDASVVEERTADT